MHKDAILFPYTLARFAPCSSNCTVNTALIVAHSSCGTTEGRGMLSPYCANSRTSPVGSTRQNSGSAEPTVSDTRTGTLLLPPSEMYLDSPGMRELGTASRNHSVSR